MNRVETSAPVLVQKEAPWVPSAFIFHGHSQASVMPYTGWDVAVLSLSLPKEKQKSLSFD